MKSCLIDNFAPHYRGAIYQKMADEFQCDFYFGRPCGKEKSIKTLPPEFFHSHAEDFPRKYLFHTPVSWISGVFKVFGKYDLYIWGGEPYCLTSWLFVLGIKLFTKQKVAFWSHGWYGRENTVKRIIKKLYFGMADHILLYGHYAESLMRKEGFPAEKMSVIHNSLNYDEQLKLRERLDLKLISEHFRNNYDTIIFSGRLIASKRLDLILHCVQELRSEGKMVNCVFVGDGPEMEKLQSLADELKIGRQVWFFGACYDENILGALFAGSAVAVSPGNVGLTAIHALTFGCPLITHNDFVHQGPEFEAVIPGKTGDFFAPGNIGEMKQLIKKWCRQTPLERERTRQACYRTIAESWTPDYQIGTLRQMMEKLQK